MRTYNRRIPLKITCSILTCGKLSSHILNYKGYNKSRNRKFLCTTCYLGYKLGRSHNRLNTKTYVVDKNL